MRWLAGVWMVAMLLQPALAEATEGIVWKWEPGQERRYLLKSQVRFAELFQARSNFNQNLRLTELETILLIRCSPTDLLTKRQVELRCAFEDVQFKGAPPAPDANRGMVKVLDGWEESLREASLMVVMGLDGRIRSMDFDGYEARQNRIRDVRERLRLLLVRTVAGLELQLPRKGDDHQKSWKQKETLIYQLPSMVGSFGTARLRSMVVNTEGSVVTINREGNGSIRSGETVGDAAQGQDRPRNTFVAEMRGTATFDTATGELLTHDYAAQAEPTASSILAQGIAATLYLQAVSVKKVDADREITLGPNMETVPGENGI